MYHTHIYHTHMPQINDTQTPHIWDLLSILEVVCSLSPSGRSYWGLGGMWLQLPLKPCSHSTLYKDPLSFLLLSAGNSLLSGTSLMDLQRNVPQPGDCTSPQETCRSYRQPAVEGPDESRSLSEPLCRLHPQPPCHSHQHWVPPVTHPF